MGRPRKNAKTSNVDRLSCSQCPGMTFTSEELLAEHLRSHPGNSAQNLESPSKLSKGPEKRKTSASRSSLPRKKAKAAAALALFSDISDVGDLPEIESSVVPENLAEETDNVSTEKKDGSDKDSPGVGAASSSRGSRQMTAELRKGSTTVPFVVTNQMALGNDIDIKTDDSLADQSDSDLFRSFAVVRPRGEINMELCEKVYECHYCRRVYFNQYSLRLHVRQQHMNSGRKIRCPHCQFVFFKLSGLRDHLSRGQCKKNKEKAQLKASEEGSKKNEDEKEEGDSNDVSSIPESLNRSVLSDVGSSRPSVGLNPRMVMRIFEPMLERAKHVVEKEGQDQKTTSRSRKANDTPCFKCDMCYKSFELKDSLLRHYKQVHRHLTKAQLKAKMKAVKAPSIVYKCLMPDCTKVCQSKKMFKMHYKNDHTAYYTQLIERHMRALDDSILYECPTCGKSYFLEASYLKHREECGDIEEDDGCEIEIDYDLLNEPWVEPKEEPESRSRRRKTEAATEPEPIASESAPDTECRYCGKLFFTVYGRMDHERKHIRGEPVSTLISGSKQEEEEPAVEDDRNSPAPSEPPAPVSVVIRCMECNKMYSSFEALERHNSNVHAPKESLHNKSLIRS